MDAPTSDDTLILWSSLFVAFLRDFQYDGPGVKHKIHNLTNIFNLLFVPEQRHKDLGTPPAPGDLIQFMINQGVLESEGEFIRVAQSSDQAT